MRRKLCFTTRKAMFYENHADKAWHADDTDDADDYGIICLLHYYSLLLFINTE